MAFHEVVAILIVGIVWFLGIAPLAAKILDADDELGYGEAIGAGGLLTVVFLIVVYIISGVLWAFKTVGGLFG